MVKLRFDQVCVAIAARKCPIDREWIETHGNPELNGKKTAKKKPKKWDGSLSLYEKALKLQQKQKALRAKTPKGCTFAPRTYVTKHRSDGTPTSVSKMHAGKKTGADMARIQALYEHSKDLDTKRAVHGLKYEDFNFHPKINRRSATYATKAASDVHSDAQGSIARGNKLYNDAVRSKMKMAAWRMKEQMAAEKKKNLTFQPQINKAKGAEALGSSRSIETPAGKTRTDLLYERGKSWMTRHSNAQVKAIRQSKELEECTFAPSLNTDAKGRQRPRAANRPRSYYRSPADKIENRLLQAGRLSAARKKEEKLEHEHETMRESTFRPKINEISELMVQSGLVEGKDVYDRLSKLGDRKERETMQERLREKYNKKEYTFTPKINLSPTQKKKAARKRQRDLDISSMQRFLTKIELEELYPVFQENGWSWE